MDIIACDEIIFPDSVHGYIHVPKPFVENLIDTEVFQRLRSIEQTGGSMRALYPSARHDRFAHSLGVFHLGRKAFQRIYEQFSRSPHKEEIVSLGLCKDNWWKKQYIVFMAACLLHDCAHAPFSHTYESYYTLQQVKDDVDGIFQGDIKHLLAKASFPMERLNYEIIKAYSCSGGGVGFSEDFLPRGNESVGVPHERMSALMVNKYFSRRLKKAAEELEVNLEDNDIQNVARMITGCVYSNTSLDSEESLMNCFISLLNSSVVDVDKLDYLMRDTLNSGMSNWDVDYERIIDSMQVCLSEPYSGSVTHFDANSSVWKAGSCFIFKPSSFSKDKASIEITGTFDVIYYPSDKVKLEACNPEVEKERSDRSLPRKLILPYSLNDEVKVTISKNSLIALNDFSGEIKGSVINGDGGINSGKSPLFELAYDEKAINALLNAMAARNQFHEQPYMNPRVLYNGIFLRRYLLKVAAKYLCCKRHICEFPQAHLPLRDCATCKWGGRRRSCKNADSVEDIIFEILGLEGFYEPESLPAFEEDDSYGLFWRSTDEDIDVLFKQVFYMNKIAGDKGNIELDCLFTEYFERTAKLPLWSSYSTFKERFIILKENPPKYSELADAAGTSMDKELFLYNPVLEKDMKERIGLEEGCDSIVIIKASPNIKRINPVDVIVAFPDNRYLRMCDVYPDVASEKPEEFYYVYIKCQS